MAGNLVRPLSGELVPSAAGIFSPLRSLNGTLGFELSLGAYRAVDRDFAGVGKLEVPSFTLVL
jgi:hypothetical protein